MTEQEEPEKAADDGPAAEQSPDSKSAGPEQSGGQVSDAKPVAQAQSDESVSEPQLSEQKLTEQKLTEKKATDQKLADEKAAQKRAAVEAVKELIVASLPAADVRPKTSNWASIPFAFTVFSWSLVAIICLLNFLLASLLVGEGEILPAIANTIYGLIVFWIFGATILGAPMVFLAVKELERRNIFAAEKHLTMYLDTVKGLRLYRDGYYTVAVANLAMIKFSRGDYHSAEVLYEELVSKIKKRRRQSKQSLTAIYINNLANVKVAQACSHPELFDLELQEAERLAKESLLIWQGEKTKKNDAAGAAYPIQVLAEIDVLRGDLSAAESKLSQVIKLNSDGKQSIYILPESRQGLYFESHFWLVLLSLKQGKKEEADVLCRRLITELKERPAPIVQHSMSVLNRVAMQYMEMGAWSDAEHVLEFAYAVARGYPVHPEAHDIALSFERLLTETGRSQEIAEMKSWIRPVLELGLE